MAMLSNCKIMQVISIGFIPYIIIVMLLTSISNAADVQDICMEIGINFEDQSSTELTLLEGEDAEIYCLFNYTSVGRKPLPFWQVQNHNELTQNFWYPGFFPQNVIYNDKRDTLTIRNIDISMNNTSIACCFNAINSICENNFTFMNVVAVPEYLTTIHYYRGFTTVTVVTVTTPDELPFHTIAIYSCSQMLTGYRTWFLLFNLLSYILCN